MKKLLIFIVLISFNLIAQDVPLLEKAHDISIQSKKGYLAQVIPNLKKNTFDMVFIFKSGFKDKVKAEIYTFDQNLNQIANNTEEIPFEKARSQWKWFSFKGDEYKYNMATASVDMKWNLTFRKKEVTQSWNWWLGQYDNSIKVLEKIKPKDEFGDNYVFKGGHYENEETHKLLMLAGKKSTSTKFGTTEYDIIEVDENVSISKIDNFKFESSYQPIFSQSIFSPNNSKNLTPDWVVVLAPNDGKGQKNKPTDMVYVRISPKGKIIEKINFQSETNGLRIIKAVENEGVVKLVCTGVDKDKESKYFDKAMGQIVSVSTLNKAEQEMSIDNTGAASKVGSLLGGKELGSMIGKFSNMDSALPVQEDLDNIFNQKDYDHFFLGQFKDNKFTSLSYPSVKDFEKVHQKPSDQKRYFDWDGKSFEIDNVSFGSDGSIMITGQDFKGQKIYKEAYCFKFDNTGKLQASYGVDVEQSGKSGFLSGKGPKADEYPIGNMIHESADHSKAYWFISKVKTIRQKTETDYDYGKAVAAVVVTTTKSFTPLRSIQYSTINNKTLEMSARKDLGDDEKRNYFLFNSNNGIRLNQYQIYLSETVKGDKILLSRFDLSK